MAVKIKKGGWALIVAIAVSLALFFGIKHLMDKSGRSQISSGIKVSSKADLVVGYNTFVGVQPLVRLNGGVEPNENSDFTKQTGLLLQIKQVDVRSDAVAALKTGDFDAIYCTTDALSIEMGSNSELITQGAKEIMKVNASQGADAIVVTKGIKTVADLKGKTVAYMPGSASNTLLINTLDAAGLTIKDIQTVEVGDGIEAANSFKAGQVDAAVVWAPDDEDCVKAQSGSKILISTATASQIIADGLLVVEKNLEKKKEDITKLVKAWLEANAKMNTDKGFQKEANEIFAKEFGIPLDVVKASSNKVRYATLGDNKQFFGFDAAFTGITGEKMYSRMSIKYTESNLVKAPAAWRKVSDASIIESLLSDESFANSSTQSADNGKVFTAPTKEQETEVAQSTKVVSIQFPTASYSLDDQAKTIIDREVTELAQAFQGARIRIEGNTDNVGNPTANKVLSEKRANAVADYLVKEHKFDKNKFIILGNGQNNPVSGCEGNADDACKSANRRTDFKFLW